MNETQPAGDGVGENGGYDIRKALVPPKKRGRFATFTIEDSRWSGAFLTLARLAQYRGTANEAQRLGNLMLHTHAEWLSIDTEMNYMPLDSVEYLKAYGYWSQIGAALDALAADAAALAKGGG